MRVVKGLARPADAYQFLKETEDQLAGLMLQTGSVTVQKADELNRIPGRCYVPTIWGAAVLEYGDWFVVYDIGVVSAFNDAQFRLLFEFDDSATLFEIAKEPELKGVQVAKEPELKGDLSSRECRSPRSLSSRECRSPRLAEARRSAMVSS